MADLDSFLDKKNIFAVIGVSKDTKKYGRIIFDYLKTHNYTVYPINPNEKFISEDKCYPKLKDLPQKPDVVVFVVPPNITKKVLVQCKNLNITKIWLQPGSESKETIDYCKNNELECLHNQCIMLV